LSVVGIFEFGGWDVSAVFVEASEVEPVDPFRGRQLDLFDGPPRACLLDQFGLVEAVDRLCEGVVVRQSPTLPTEAATPTSARRSLNLIDVY
jgi:hypothetical protein